jgi:hypothetical protein
MTKKDNLTDNLRENNSQKNNNLDINLPPTQLKNHNEIMQLFKELKNLCVPDKLNANL